MHSKNKNKSHFIKLLGIFFLLIGAGAFLFFASARSTDESLPVEAPLNPKFLEYIEMQEQGLIKPMYTAEGYSLGVIPSPHKIGYIEDFEDQDIEGFVALAKKYDLRDLGRLTGVKDQGECGSCWAFSSWGMLESGLMPGQSLKIKEVWDFSEQHLITKHGFEGGPCDGGNIDMTVAYMGRGDGPIDELDSPYIYTSALDVKKRIQDVIYIPKRKSSKDNKDIKKAVQEYGAVFTVMRYDSSKYNSTYCSYYNPDLDEGPHAVCIVGWDDKFSKNKFNETPPRNGAFIVRNSWGTDYGEDGYFYVSYYDDFFAKISKNAAIGRVKDADIYTETYQYDPSGWVNSYGWNPDDTAWFANIFKAKSSSSIKAVSFYAVSTKSSYTAYIYTGVSNNQPRSGTLAAQKSGSSKLPGYYTVDIGPVQLTAGEKFSVVVKMRTKGFGYPIPIEYHHKGYTQKKNCKGKKGQSFVSHYGDYWYDLFTIVKKANVCLKTFAK